MRTRRRTAGICAVLSGALLLSGCGGGSHLSAATMVKPSAGATIPADVPAAATATVITPSNSSSPLVTTGTPTPSAKVPAAAATATATAKKKATTAKTKKRANAASGSTRSGSTGGCGSSRSKAWASWPMPNPGGLGLPNAASYRDQGNGSVKDKVTCLVWQKSFSPTKLSWSAAKAYCSGLSIGGKGWRLPSRVELTSIFDFTRSGPAINTKVFTGIANFFWTSSPWAVSHTPKYAWAMNFYEGLTTNAGNTQGAYFARCVKAPTGSGAATYTSVTAGERKDNQTGLIWQRATAKGGARSAAAAKSYCAGLTLDGHKWRLPSIKELATTVDESRVAPAINRSVFPDTMKSSYYWSSSKAAPSPSSTWALSYDDGFTNYRNIGSAYVRCVR